MNWTDLIIVLIVLLLAGLAALYTWRHKDSCADCPSSGSCSSKGAGCPSHPKSGGPTLVERYRKDHPKN